MTSVETQNWAPMTPEQRADFERDGFVMVKSALNPSEVEQGQEALERARQRAAANGGIAADGSMHTLSAITNAPELAFLIDHPSTFGHVWSVMGWNVHIYHSHLDIHPPLAEPKPTWWHWHQDGGRQNREIETDPRPRLSIKVAYWFSDVSETGRGNFSLIPGSHLQNWLPGPPKRGVEWPKPEGAIEVTAEPGDAVVFDRRIWHARTDNHSTFTRMGAFFGYTYRWVAIRDELESLHQDARWDSYTPVQKQLLGGLKGDGDHQWGHFPESTPLYGELAARGLLDGSTPPLIP